MTTNPLEDAVAKFLDAKRGGTVPAEPTPVGEKTDGDNQFAGVTLMIGIAIDSDTIRKAIPEADVDEVIAVLSDPTNDDYDNWVKAILIGGTNAKVATSVFNSVYKPRLLGVGVSTDTDRDKFNFQCDGTEALLGMTEDQALEAVKGMARQIATAEVAHVLGSHDPSTASGQAFVIEKHDPKAGNAKPWGRINDK